MMTFLTPCCCAGCLVKRWLNITVVPAWAEGETDPVPPYFRPDANTYEDICTDYDLEDEDYYIACGPWKLSERPSGTTLNNTFEEQTEEVDHSEPTLYFKNVQARKFWQGRRGLDELDVRFVWKNAWQDYGGGAEFPLVETEEDTSCPSSGAFQLKNAVATAPTTRYCTEERWMTYSGTFNNDNGSGGTIADTLSYARDATATISKTSGVLTQDDYNESITLSHAVDGVDVPSATIADLGVPWVNATCYLAGIPNSWNWLDVIFGLDAAGGRIGGNFAAFDPCNTAALQGYAGMGSLGGETPYYFPSGWTPAEIIARFTYDITETDYTKTQTCECEVTDTTIYFKIIYEWTYDDGSTTASAGCTVEFGLTVSNPYTASQLKSDLEALMALIPLTDDCKYPWRAGDCTVAPLVRRREQMQDNMSLAMLSGYTEDASTYYDGTILGQLLPNGYEGFFAFDHEVYEWDGFGWNRTGWGATMTGYDLPLNVTEWTNMLERETVYPCAYLRFSGDELWGQKWAERKLAFPSINFFRPCGPDRARTVSGLPAWDDADVWPICGRIAVASAVQSGGDVNITLATSADQLQDGDLVDFTGVGGLGAGLTVSSAAGTTFTVSGTLSGPYTSGGYVSSNGAPSYVWNDDATKGDWQTREWLYDYRLSGEFARLDAASTYYTGCTSWVVPTDPGTDIDTFTLTQETRIATGKVMACTPNGETWPGGDTSGFSGSFVVDDLYGSLWLFQILQAIPDPFFKYDPDMPSETAKYVEALNEPPVGAPDVHEDVTIGCDVDTCAAPSTGADPCAGLPYNHPPGTGI